MQTTLKYFITFCILFLITEAQERVLLRIRDGKQEAYSMQKGESANDAIERIENEPAEYIDHASGLVDTIKYYPGVAKASTSVLNTNFGFTSQDIALQWYHPEADGIVKEFWWRNYPLTGLTGKATVRAWYVNELLSTVPVTPQTGAMGYYKDPHDGFGLVTPFKPAMGDQWFYKTGDSLKHGFDPLGNEASWLSGGLIVNLDSSKWQGINLSEWGDTMRVKLGQIFGFTVMNNSSTDDNVAGHDVRMELGAIASAGHPYHSYKWYETGRTTAADKGWHLRGDFEWGMYVVVEYTGDRAPLFQTILPTYMPTLLASKPIKVQTVITDDNPSGGQSGIASANVKYKTNNQAEYGSVPLIQSGDVWYQATFQTGNYGDTVYYFLEATDINGNRRSTPMKSYRIFKKTSDRLFVYNNNQYSLSTAGLIYLGNSKNEYDKWSIPNDGYEKTFYELLAMYDNIIIADGNSPLGYLGSEVAYWLKSGTSTQKKNLFFTSQDYGCLLNPHCVDTTFVPGDWEYDFLGIEKIGPQNLLPANEMHRIIPEVDTVTNYIIAFSKDSVVKLWYDPFFELQFSGRMDVVEPVPGANVLFREGRDSLPVGIIFRTEKFTTMYTAFDAGALQFKYDSTYCPSCDEWYWWINDVKPLAVSFFESNITSVNELDYILPIQFELFQNYPNPFNPTTSLKYNVPFRSNIEVAIYNVLGQKITTLVNDTHEVGQHRITWNGRDSFGRQVASGIYFYQMNAGSFQSVKKMVLLR